jgi:TRAP-type C4-dicarboxylate transport system substrate-binding protein
MPTQFIRCAALAALLVASAAGAEPITLKMPFFTSDRSTIYQCQIKPFVDAVNADKTQAIRVEVDFGPSVDRTIADQPKLLMSGAADIAIVAPTATPEAFPDTAVALLPGLFKDQSEAGQVYLNMVQTGALADYRNFFVIGTAISANDDIHSRKPLAKLADLHGQTIRGSNPIEIETLKALGANSFFLPFNRTMDSLAQGKIDGVTGAPAIMYDFGFARLTSHHFMLGLGSVPSILAMSRARFESLPGPAQAVVRKYSGAWLMKKSIACLEAKGREILKLFEQDPRRTVTFPSPADQATADTIFSAVIEKWAAQSPRHRALLSAIKAEIARVRAAR